MQLEVGWARDESSCLLVGFVGSVWFKASSVCLATSTRNIVSTEYKMQHLSLLAFCVGCEAFSVATLSFVDTAPPPDNLALDQSEFKFNAQ